jgi:hypothetical protein
VHEEYSHHWVPGRITGFSFYNLYVIVQLLQIQRLIPSPLDEVLIYSTSLCIVIPFIMEILALHYTTSADKRFWTHAAVIFTTLYAFCVSSNYVVQLATVLPMKQSGRASEIALLEQTPHSLFWDFDALGYIFMGLAMLSAMPALAKERCPKICKTGFHRQCISHTPYQHRLFLPCLFGKIIDAWISLGRYSSAGHVMSCPIFSLAGKIDLRKRLVLQLFEISFRITVPWNSGWGLELKDNKPLLENNKCKSLFAFAIPDTNGDSLLEPETSYLRAR